MWKICILWLCVLKLSVQDFKADDSKTQTINNAISSTVSDAVADTNTEDKTTLSNKSLSKENNTINESADAVGDNSLVNGTVEGVDTDITGNTTTLRGSLFETKGSASVNETANETNLNNNIEATQTTVEPKTNANETFLNKVERVVKRLFKREVVGSLVSRFSDELRENPKITVPMFYQSEYYQLRLRKEEIERNKRIYAAAPNKTVHEDLIQHTWELLVNWSRDHLAFEDKIIKIHQLKTHAHIQRTKEVDSDATEDSEDKLRSIDSDEDSDKSMRPEFATVKNLNEVNERYVVENNIEKLEREMRDNPQAENNEKNRILLNQYQHELKMIGHKYDRIRAMKLNRELVEELWQEKKMIDKKKEKKDTDEED